MFIMTFQNEHTWDVSPDIGFITFATPEDAKKAEELFNRVQAEAKVVVKDAERYRWLRNSDNAYPLFFIAQRDPRNIVVQFRGELADANIDAAMSP